LALATVFLVISGLWDVLVAIERFVIGLVPWATLKRRLVALVDVLPTSLVLLLFVVPLLIVEPLLVVATIAIAMGYVVIGCIAWIILKFLAIALIPAIFDLTQHRLMTLPWFAWVYRKFMKFHHYAHRLVSPYQHAAAAVLRAWRRRGAAVAGRMPGVAQLAARFAARRRATNGRPPVPSNG
jgi:hypothetical protein